MKKRIVIEDDTLEVEGAKNYPLTEVIADLVCALVSATKESRVSKETLIECVMTAWNGRKDQEMIS